MLSKIQIIAIFFTFLFQLILINSKNYWECYSNPKVICQQTQTCCKIVKKSPSKNSDFNSFECFEGQNKICCGSTGVCEADEFCNPLINKCQKLKFNTESKEKKPENKNQIMLYKPPRNLQIHKNNKNEISLETTSKVVIQLLDNFEIFIKNDVPKTLYELRSIEISFANVPEFFDGFMSGLKIFESAYRNSTCAMQTQILIDDSFELISLFKNLKFDEHFFDKLHLAVDMLKHIYQDYLKQQKSCVPTFEKISCIMNKIMRRFNQRDFPRKLIGHTIIEFHELEKKVKDGFDAMKHQKFYQAGFNYGDVLRLFAFWDFESLD